MPGPSHRQQKASEDTEDRSEDFWRLCAMGFNEDQANLILAEAIPLYRFISLVEIRKCPPHLALEILRD